MVGRGVLREYAARHGVFVRLRPRVGEHIVAGTTLAWAWRPSDLGLTHAEAESVLHAIAVHRPTAT